MKMRVFVKEVSYGVITVDVPEGATEDEIYPLVENQYFGGNTYWNDSDWDITGMEED